jgi:anti-sigma factor RsiW
VPLTCRELVELVTDYLEGCLSESERARFEAHLERCGGCARYLEQVRKTVRLARKPFSEDLPADARAALLHAFRDWR